MDEEIIDDNLAVIQLNSLPEKFDAIRAAIKYGREDSTLGIDVFAMRFKELDLRTTDKIMFGNGDAFTIRGRNDKKGYKVNTFNSRSKSRTRKNLRWFICQKEGHFNRDYTKWKKKTEM